MVQFSDARGTRPHPATGRYQCTYTKRTHNSQIINNFICQVLVIAYFICCIARTGGGDGRICVQPGDRTVVFIRRYQRKFHRLRHQIKQHRIA